MLIMNHLGRLLNDLPGPSSPSVVLIVANGSYMKMILIKKNNEPISLFDVFYLPVPSSSDSGDLILSQFSCLENETQ